MRFTRNTEKPRWRLLDESCPVEKHPELRETPTAFAKVKQDEIVTEYGKKFGIPYVIVRPGHVYGPGNGWNYRRGWGSIRLVSSCILAVPTGYRSRTSITVPRPSYLAGLKEGVDGEVFNVVDDDLPSSRQFLRLYKRNVREFKSLYVPHAAKLCALLLVGAIFDLVRRAVASVLQSEDDGTPFGRRRAISNAKLKTQVGWAPKVPMAEGFRRYFEGCRSEDNMLKVAIVGCGKIADAHASQIQRIKGCEIVGVCDKEPLMARQLYERFPVKRYF